MDYDYDFSVIIPLYNCEKYITKSVESIINQEGNFFSKTQVLIIDDGSTDNGGHISKTYSKKYPNNIFYYKKENGNWGSVINYVSKNKLAKGKFVTVLDADDFYEKNAFSTVFDYFNYDMIISDFFCLKSGSLFPLKVCYGKKRCIMEKNKLHTPHSQPLAKFYSNNLFYSIPFLKENLWYQDCIFYHSAVNIAKNVMYINKPLATWFSDRPGNSTSAQWSNDAKFYAWCDTLKSMVLYGAGIIIYIYALLPGFLVELKKRNKVLVLSKKPDRRCWMPFLAAWFFTLFIHFRTRKYITYP